MLKLNLPQAYEVLAFARIGDAAVVLCRLPDNSATPFATWKIYFHDAATTRSGAHHCNHGDYCRDAVSGWHSFLERAKLNPLDMQGRN